MANNNVSVKNKPFFDFEEKGEEKSVIIDEMSIKSGKTPATVQYTKADSINTSGLA